MPTREATQIPVLKGEFTGSKIKAVLSKELCHTKD